MKKKKKKKKRTDGKDGEAVASGDFWARAQHISPDLGPLYKKWLKQPGQKRAVMGFPLPPLGTVS